MKIVLMKSRVFVSAVCFIAITQALGADRDEDGFQRSNYYTNDQGSNVGEIQNQGKNAAKRQNKKVEHFRNNHAKYQEPKRYNANKNDRGMDGPNAMQANEGYSPYKQVEGKNGLEKRSQQRRGDSRVGYRQSKDHFRIPSERVQYHDGQSNGRPSHQNSEAQRPVRKSFNEQPSNWRWGFRRKPAKDHLKETSSYVGGNHNYKSKESVNGHNAHCEAMVRNGHFSENSDMESNARQNVIQRESKMVGMKVEEQYQRAYAPRQRTSDEQMYRAVGQPTVRQNAPQWDSKERADVADYQYDNVQKPELQPPTAGRWMQDGTRNAYNAPKFQSKEIPSPYRDVHPEIHNDAMGVDHPKIDYNHELNAPIDSKVVNKPVENPKLSNGLMLQTQNQIPPQMSEVRNNNYESKIERIQNSPDDQKLDQFQTGNDRYENGLNMNIPRTGNAQQETMKFGAQDAAPRTGAAGVDEQVQENRWDDGSPKINARMKPPNAANSRYNPGDVPGSLELRQKARQPRPQTEEIRYLVLSPAEFNPETLRRSLGESEKPRGIPCCTLEEYKMESASLKAKSYDAHDRDMRYNGKGSINELISRLKRNNRQTLRGSGRRPIKSRASGEGPEMPVHACTATPSTREHCIGIVTQTEAVEATTMCWVESLTRPTVSAEDLGINFRITPSYFYDHLRGRLPIISQFDYTACTSCSTPCEEPCGKGKRHVRFSRNKRKRTPDEMFLSDIIRTLQNKTAPEMPEPRRILPNALEEEKIIEKYLTALMEDEINQTKTQMKNTPFNVGPGWLAKLLKELAENKLKSKMKNAYTDNPRLERHNQHSH